MTKLERNKYDKEYVFGFVPTYALPIRTPWSLDPLVTELEDVFIDGKIINAHIFFFLFQKNCADISANYSEVIGGIKFGPATIGCTLP